MTKIELTTAVNDTKNEVKSALQTIYDALNSGQQNKLIKNETVKALFYLYGVEL